MRALTLGLFLGLFPALAAPALAETLGWGRIFSNDYMGDGHDRWRSGSFALSHVSGAGWDGAPPALPDALVELRFRTEIIAPARTRDGRDDRPYVGLLAGGAFLHQSFGPVETATGGEIIAIGPSTKLSAFQERAHEVMGFDEPRGTERQLDDALQLQLRHEAALPLRPMARLTLRPFLAAEAGAEEMLRAGVDAIWGGIGHTDLWLRDPVTGQPYRGIEAEATGLALTVGADAAWVEDSVFLPGREARDRRRARIGLHWQSGPEVRLFYGLTWLSEEFDGQYDSQVLGALKLEFGH
ncbi:lipid A-modifier LpxR family protein [Limimaricola litoreus]|uniref:Lipid A deacylase LpxR family protein n=1 Tax=Limimaricola litoreus TaxID=2955316 RepID=A0A9X2FSG7_9RHOB|nr:lipid A-modifier LpxR family protein [Limimaricola litoreus]MCP1169820.1 lipid A deacylase LpxR family protein [Limimaricola litoreus]